MTTAALLALTPHALLLLLLPILLLRGFAACAFPPSPVPLGVRIAVAVDASALNSTAPSREAVVSWWWWWWWCFYRIVCLLTSDALVHAADCLLTCASSHAIRHA